MIISHKSLELYIYAIIYCSSFPLFLTNAILPFVYVTHSRSFPACNTSNWRCAVLHLSNAPKRRRERLRYILGLDSFFLLSSDTPLSLYSLRKCIIWIFFPSTGQTDTYDMIYKNEKEKLTQPHIIFLLNFSVNHTYYYLLSLSMIFSLCITFISFIYILGCPSKKMDFFCLSLF